MGIWINHRTQISTELVNYASDFLDGYKNTKRTDRRENLDRRQQVRVKRDAEVCFTFSLTISFSHFLLDIEYN